MIIKDVIDGRPATLAFVTADMNPCLPEDADMAVVLFEDGEKAFVIFDDEPDEEEDDFLDEEGEAE